MCSTSKYELINELVPPLAHLSRTKWSPIAHSITKLFFEWKLYIISIQTTDNFNAKALICNHIFSMLWFGMGCYLDQVSWLPDSIKHHEKKYGNKHMNILIIHECSFHFINGLPNMKMHKHLRVQLFFFKLIIIITLMEHYGLNITKLRFKEQT